MFTPKSLREIAHVFGDPLLESTGLEGGHLDSALQLMLRFINETLKTRFTKEAVLLEKITLSLRRCIQYIELIKEDRLNSTGKATQKILEDINILKGDNFIVFPGGWVGKTKPGHAMLYVLTGDLTLTIINTGAGAIYHAKEIQPNAIQCHPFVIKLKSKDCLLTTSFIPALIQMQIKPQDYYNASFLYEVIFGMLEGEVGSHNLATYAYDLQFSGTCFWQCVDKLLFYFFKNQPKIYQAMQLTWERYLLENIYSELQGYISFEKKISDSDLVNSSWKTYFRLIIFSARSFSVKYLKNNYENVPHLEAKNLCFKLEKLAFFAENELGRIVNKITNYCPYIRETRQIDSRFTLFDRENPNKPKPFLPLPNINYKQQPFIVILENILAYIKKIENDEFDCSFSIFLLIENLFLNLPLPGTIDFNLLQKQLDTIGKIEAVINKLNILYNKFYRLHRNLFSRPVPEQYAEQLVSGFSVFCFVDAIIKQLPMIAFIKQYTPCLSHMLNNKDVLEIAPLLILKSPELVERLKHLCQYLLKNRGKKLIFNFKKNESYLAEWGINIKHDEPNDDVDFFGECLTQFERHGVFNATKNSENINLKIAEGIIDSNKRFLPNFLHDWRQIAILSRLLMTSMESQQITTISDLWLMSAQAGEQNAKINLSLLLSHKNDEVPLWSNFSACLIRDTAIQWLCDTPLPELIENQILTKPMPAPTAIPRRLFNQLAEIRIAQHMQIFTTLELLSQNVHYLQIEDIRHLLERYLFEASKDVFELGSLLYQEFSNSTQVKQYLLNFMSSAEYYFGGQENNIDVYLGLLKTFVSIENFIIRNERKLICITLFDKLQKFLGENEDHQAKVSSHLILLYKNYLKSETTPQIEYLMAIRILSCWAVLLRSKQLNQDFTTQLYLQAKRVLLDLQEIILRVVHNKAQTNIIFNKFLMSILKLPVIPEINWEAVGPGCAEGAGYFINLFDGKIFYKNYPLEALPDQVLGNKDYQELYSRKLLAIKIENSSEMIEVYCTTSAPSQLLTLYKPDLEQKKIFLQNLLNSEQYQEYTTTIKHPPIEGFLQMFKNRILKNKNIFRVKYKLDSKELLIVADEDVYLATLSQIVRVYIFRNYGINCYPELIYCDDIFKSYFLPEKYETQLIDVQTYCGLKAEVFSLNSEVIIHKQCIYQNQFFWAQYLPHWRLEGLVPASILDKNTAWLACTFSPTDDFMEIEEKTSVKLSGESKTILLVDKEQRNRYVFNLFSNNQIRLWELNSHGQGQREWIDLLSLEMNSPLIKLGNLLHRFELPTYILTWKDIANQIFIELPRHQLDFTYQSTTNSLLATQFNDFTLIDMVLPGIPQFPYQLVLKNSQEEYIVVLPNVSFVKYPFANIDPLHGSIASSLACLGSPSYFVYDYLEDTQQLKANSIISEQYLALLYAKNHNYSSCHRHIQHCWTDQQLTSQQWELFLKFFRETMQDSHPDMHSCRLQYFLIFKPLFTILQERKDEKDTLREDEIKQLVQYSNLLENMLEDYDNYLCKWDFLRESIRLSLEAEMSLYDLCRSWECAVPNNVRNRFAILSNPDQAVLRTPSYSILKWVHSFDEIVLQPLSPPVSNIYFKFDDINVDCFGFYHDKKASVSECFNFLYKGYMERKFTPIVFSLILRSLFWNNNLFLNNSNEIYLLKILHRLLKFAPEQLPKPYLGNNKNYFCTNMSNNFVDESRQNALWFIQLTTFLGKILLPNATITKPDIFKHMYPKEIEFQFVEVGSNKLPKEKIFINEVKKQATCAIKIGGFKEKYGFDPNWPLERYFTHFFSFETEKIALVPFPLLSSIALDGEFKRLLTESDFGTQLMKRFKSDYDIYLEKPQKKFKIKPTAKFDQEVQKNILDNFHKLNSSRKNVLLQILTLCNKNPFNIDNQQEIYTREEYEAALTMKYKILGSQHEKLTFAVLLEIFSKQELNSYLTRNPFLSKSDADVLNDAIASYLLLSCIIKQIKRVLILMTSLAATEKAKERESIVQQIAKECYQHRHYSIVDKPLFLLYEYHTACMLWEEQEQVIDYLLKPLFQEQVEQLIMGAGKTSIVAPLVGHILADGKRLMVYTVPSSLIAIFTQLLRNRFTGPFSKEVHVLSFSRSTLLTAEISRFYLNKILEIISNKGVLVVTPEVPNCLLLKWIEISQQIHRGNNKHSETLDNIEKILAIIQSKATQLIDELDLVLAPLKSELNFTEGLAQNLEPAPLRWTYPQELLLMILTHPTISPVLENAIKQHDCKGHGNHRNFRHGMLELVNTDFYHNILKPKLIPIILSEHFNIKSLDNYEAIILHSYLIGDSSIKTKEGVFLDAVVIDSLTRADCISQELRANLTLLLEKNSQFQIVQSRKYFFLKDQDQYKMYVHPLIATMISTYVKDIYNKDELKISKLVLAKEWLATIVPYVLQKRLHIHYGPYFELLPNKNNISRKKRFLSKKLAIPYTGKDSPSRRSEFQNSEIVIALTCLQYFYIGLTYKEFVELLLSLQDRMKAETSVSVHQRKAVTLFRDWQKETGQLLIELHQVNVTDKRNTKKLYFNLNQNIALICYYLENNVFPKFLKVYSKKLTSNSFDLAGMMFGVTKGFSGTFHNPDCLPENLSVRFQQGVDGSMFYILNLPWNQTIISLDFQDDLALLNQINLNEFQMLIDTGGLIQYLSNIEVAQFLLSKAPLYFKGVIFVDNGQQQLQVLLRTGIIQPVIECNISPQYLFKYIDHAHTTGLDVPQHVLDRGIITLNSQSTLRELFQGAKRLRKLGVSLDQSIAFLLRNADIKQIRLILNLKPDEKLMPKHVFQWAFTNTLKQATQELQITSFQRMHLVTRKRAFQLLLGKFCIDKLPGRLSDIKKLQLQEDLVAYGILDNQLRVRKDLSITVLKESTNLLNELELEDLKKGLSQLYKYKIKQADNEIVYICLEAFSERFHYDILQMLSLDVCKYTSEQLMSFQDEIKNSFSAILLSSDNENLRLLAIKVQKLLPKWSVTRELYQEVQKDKDQTIEVSSLIQQQNENEKIKAQQQERESQSMSAFTACPRITWSYERLVSSPIQSLIVNQLKISLNNTTLRLVRINEFLKLPFHQSLMMSENFLRTEESSPVLKGFSKNIQVYLEIQENQQLFFILIDMHEAEYIKDCIKNKLLESKSIALRLLSGSLVVKTQKFKEHPIPEVIQVQLFFLSGVSENEMPQTLMNAWQEWKGHVDIIKLVETQKDLQLALSK